MSETKKTSVTIPKRSEIPAGDTWDLSSLFDDDESWKKALGDLEASIPKLESFRGTLGESVEHFAEAIGYIQYETKLLGSRLNFYINLRMNEDLSNTDVQGLYNQFQATGARYDAATSWVEPEILSLEEGTIQSYLKHPLLADYRISLTKLLRFKPHVLSEKEEKLLAMQGEFEDLAERSFDALTDADMQFGSIETPEGERALSQSSMSTLQLHEDRSVREKAWRQFYQVYDDHKNTLASLLNGNVLQDKFRAEIRGFPSARARALFPDKVPESVYDNLISTVRANLPALHDYYKLREEKLALEDGLHPWDLSVSLVKGANVHHTWDQAVEAVCTSLQPLGSEYVSTLRAGLTSDRWVDRYENQGKSSGAFSSGNFTSNPFILMNYKEEDFRHVFTLAHEAGHSMHSWYSKRNNPFPHYRYTIFEAEVASTFNEQLLAHSLLKSEQNPAIRAYITGKQIDDVISTIYRQTMFAEFEKQTHAMVEANEPLTVDSIRECYRKLQEDYYGPDIHLQPQGDLVALRIPHFYFSFYVYKYATGLSAAMALFDRVMNGGSAERDQYLQFLSSGGSHYPIESLKLAGVDMESPGPIEAALKRFAGMVQDYRRLLGEIQSS